MDGRGGARENAGRKKGKPNRDKQQLIDMIQEEYPEYHPLLAMAKIANDEDEDKNLKFQASKEVCKYIVPQLKAVELTGKDGKDLIPSLSDEELLTRINKLTKPE